MQSSLQEKRDDDPPKEDPEKQSKQVANERTSSFISTDNSTSNSKGTRISTENKD